VLVVLIAIGVGVSFLFRDKAANGSIAPLSKNALLSSDRFYDGVFVDDIPLNGLTRDEAKKQVEDKQKIFAQSTGVTVVSPDNTSMLLKIADLPDGAYGFDTDDVLDAAYKKGREGATDEEKLAYIKQLPENPVKLATTVVFNDLASLEQKVRGMTAPYYQAPVNAAYIPGEYDATKSGIDRLSFSDAAPGRQVNPDTLWEAVKAELENGTFGSVKMTIEDVPPVVTKAMIQADMQLLHLENIPAYPSASASVTKSLNEANKDHTFTTRIRNSSDPRMTNIGLASASVSGLVLPGEIFDFNVRTGIRNYEAGYKDAPVDIAGTEDVGIGGGVCQVSSTLYNAVIRYGGKYEAGGGASTADRPGLAVIERDNHSVPSGYVMRGMDATVDMQLPSGKSNKNLRFRNDFDKPVLIVLYSEKIGSVWYEHCDIYGPPITENGSPVTYDVVGRNNKKLELNPLATPVVRYSKFAKQGNPELKSGGDGFTIDVYVDKTLNGETTSYKIYSDRCDPQPPYWYIYPGEAVPTLTPTPTASPTPPPASKPPATETAPPEGAPSI
jgi:hypothetical protein